MTSRRDSMPCLNGASAHWDAEAGKVRYYASFDGSNDWIEVPAEDFTRLTQLATQEAIDVICDAITTTLDRMNDVMGELMALHQAVEEMYERQYPTKSDAEKEN